MKDTKDMNLEELADKVFNLEYCVNGCVREISDRLRELHEEARWIPVSERLPTKGDSNFHDEVMVSLDPMSIVNSPFGMMGIETVEYSDVCPSKHTHWKRTTEPNL
jgi:hypothetical protein